MRIEKEFKKSGYFWLPENDNHKIPGVLSIFDGGAIQLEIIGHFVDGIEVFRMNLSKMTILGIVEEDGFVTLRNCFYTKKNVSWGGVSKSRMHVEYVLSGVAKEDCNYFNKFSFSTDCLDEWVGISGITVNNEFEKRSCVITYHPKDSIPIVQYREVNIEISFKYALPGYPAIKEAKITQGAYFTLESPNCLCLDDFIEIGAKIVNLMCFAMDKVITIKDVIVTSPEVMSDGPEDKKYFVPIKVYYESIPFIEKVNHIHPIEMLFDFEMISKDPGYIFNRWLTAYENFAPALDLYFSAITGSHKYLDGKFLALVQGIETYHRRTSKHVSMDPKIFNGIVCDLIKECPDEYKNWLKGRLKHGNEISLSQRIKMVVEPFKEFFGNNSRRKKLVKKIVDTRNYMTHYSEELKDCVLTGNELSITCDKLEAIFNLHLLKEIGFAEEEILVAAENRSSLKRKLKK